MKVTVLLIAYNQEQYIAKAIESVLEQEASFDFELIISEDASTDSTRDIVCEYATRYPARIRLLLSDTNLNTNEVMLRGFRVSQAQYVALLDGDDYWTSPIKLQKQVDFLDGHPTCTICSHDVVTVHEDGRPGRSYGPIRRISTLKDIAIGQFISTCSVLLRRSAVSKFPSWFNSVYAGDWALFLLYAEHGDIGHIDEAMAVYRIHSQGAWSRLSRPEQCHYTIEVLSRARTHLGHRFERLLTRRIALEWYNLALELKEGGDSRQHKLAARAALAEDPRDPKLWMLAYAEPLFWPLRKLRYALGCFPIECGSGASRLQ